MPELSRKAIDTLRWFRDQPEPPRHFGGGKTPSHHMVARLHGAGLLEVVNPIDGKLAAYRISTKGRDALRDY